MPFGAELRGAEGVRFRLWAPGAKNVNLVLPDAETPRELPMPRLDGGWFELVSARAGAGSRYAFRIDNGPVVPDPASRSNPEDVHGPSVVIDPESFEWNDDGWRGRPWHEAVIYELHVGTFSPEGTFAGVERRLDHLVELGVTVLELMPVADFPGNRGWGYDGVLPYAPESVYGTPDDLKSLVDAAHGRQLALMLDVVYNHFGPEGNYLHACVPEFFSDRHQTPWGQAINYDGPHSGPVRDFFRHNALYWLEEFHLDGLRLDAVHAFRDDSKPHILTEMAGAIRAGPGRERPIYLVLENHANEAHYLAAPGSPQHYDAQWNDDTHHCLHVLVTGETDGYYEDYADSADALLARALAEGFAYQGEPSRHAGGAPRGEPSRHLPPTAFVPFLQTHDQVGNRAFGERLCHLAASDEALHAATAILLLAPSPPLLFMGEEWAAAEPFLYFCDFGGELAASVRDGRRREFAGFKRFKDPAIVATIPDPVAVGTFQRSQLDWGKLGEGAHLRWLERYRRLLGIRRREIVPLVPLIRQGSYTAPPHQGMIAVDWTLADGAVLRLRANLSARTAAGPDAGGGRTLFTTHASLNVEPARSLEPWSVTWQLGVPDPAG